MKVLIVGLGSIARKHIIVLREIFQDNIEIYALRSSKLSAGEENIFNVYTFAEIKFRPDFIIVSNNTNLHAKTILEVTRYGCPLMIEKPIMHDLHDSEKILRELESLDIKTYCACNMRFHPALKFVKANLSSMGAVNEVNIYCGSYLPEWRVDVDFRKSYSANVHMGGGVHLDLIHEMDYTTWIFGYPTKMTSIKRSSSSLKINAVDFALFNLMYDSFVATITLNYYRKGPKRSIEILFENDTWCVDLLRGEILDSKGEIVFFQSFDMMDTYRDQMRYFLDKIETGEEMMNSFPASLKNLQLAIRND